MKYGLVFIMLLLITPLILADGTIIDDTLRIKISNTTAYNLTTKQVNLKLEFISVKDSYNNVIFPIDITRNNFSWVSEDIPYRVVSQITAENIDFAEDWKKCQTEKAGFERGWQSCQNELSSYKGENATLCKTDLDDCLLTLREKDSTISTKDSKITELESEKSEKENSKYFWGFGGVVLGILGLLFYQGKLGRGTAKEKSMGEFNKQQAG